jgi:hypothetical protein
MYLLPLDGGSVISRKGTPQKAGDKKFISHTEPHCAKRQYVLKYFLLHDSNTSHPVLEQSDSRKKK